MNLDPGALCILCLAMADKVTKDQIAELKNALSFFDEDGDGIVTTRELGVMV